MPREGKQAGFFAQVGAIAHHPFKHGFLSGFLMGLLVTQEKSDRLHTLAQHITVSIIALPTFSSAQDMAKFNMGFFWGCATGVACVPLFWGTEAANHAATPHM